VIVIIGGGITGLAAAYELAVEGIPFVLLEEANRVGGLILTEHVGGCTIDSGADSMLVQKPAAIRLCEELGLSGSLVPSTPPRTAYIHARGALHPLPTPSVFGIPMTAAGVDAFELLSPDARAFLRKAIAEPHDVDSAGDESVASFFRRHFGPETVDLIAAPLLGGIHAGDVEQLSMKLVAPRLIERTRELGRGTPVANQTADADGMFRSLDGGMGTLASAIESRLPRGSVRLQRRALTITAERDRLLVGSTGEAFTARAVILAAPAHAAADLLVWIDPDLAELCAQVPYVSTASVAFAWRRSQIAHPLNGSGFVVARRHSSLRITASTWISSKWPGRAPDGVALLRAFVGGATDPEIASVSDDELSAIAVRDVSSVLNIAGAPLFTHVHRWLDAGAQHNVGHAARMQAIEDRLSRVPGVFVAGSGFRSIGIPDCVADGRAAGAAAARYVKIHS
jgi:protoporphyrinogen/coproporphyrinogen III oxidase